MVILKENKKKVCWHEIGFIGQGLAPAFEERNRGKL